MNYDVIENSINCTDMNYDVIENSKADLRLSRRKALELLPVLRKRDEGGRIVRIDARTIKIVRNR